MVIKVVDVVAAANTGDQGYSLYLVLRSAMSNSDVVVLSFEGVPVATSSFVNAAFVSLLDEFSFPNIKAKLRVVQSTKQINDLIRARLAREAGKLAA
jgi:hypothetical protein